MDRKLKRERRQNGLSECVCVHALCVSSRTGTIRCLLVCLLVCLLARSLDCLFVSDAIVICLYAFIEYKLVAHHRHTHTDRHTSACMLTHTHTLVILYTRLK